ncbi:hypothetical protein A2313_00795 [Candidatus Roizmanbacteria bacterium RIFOXYB2_FULL_41_10]|nr:MAG: hypothetical protein A2262_00200 [Candidatus Roizmanbacteria bacterium RIFOXYA2_FULL_41_8]OGK68864.1 MAG: hypothetical protein A2313_00795 [Candidatus Roizmanbacteria bacterium RIFOXYB2_FULL_41_10]OGK74646.1 MAG: hypothetical protein A2459_01540 [Candidatus Roizmanbacteria bacterium RIFOXYC2_FULL_41_10]OGK74660.1 MAG: hypothetical protein A2575_01035 [Candidatus Roizmanbacteria bacterium RIFOXYD1_FULL_41_24]
MREVTEVKRVLNKIRRWGLEKRYKKQKKLFISNPGHRSLDFIMLDHKFRICSFKVNNQYRVKVIKRDINSYVVIDIGDYHKKQ